MASAMKIAMDIAGGAGRERREMALRVIDYRRSRARAAKTIASPKSQALLIAADEYLKPPANMMLEARHGPPAGR